MFRKLSKIMGHINLKEQSFGTNGKEVKTEIDKIPKSLIDIKKKLKATFTESGDLVLREIEVGQETPIKMIIAYIEGLVDKNRIDNSIIIPLLSQSETYLIDERLHRQDRIKSFMDKLIPTSQAENTYDFKKTVWGILSGHVLIYIDGENKAIKVANQQTEKRSITEPEAEKAIRGPREGFIEILSTNVSLLRQIIKNSKFKLETMEVGEQTSTTVGICYIKGIADESIIDTVKKRLSKINVDAILDSGYIEQYIEDNPFSIFPTIGNSERPDKVASKTLEGRVAILVDGSPSVLTVPNLFLENLQVTEDYYSKMYFAFFNRTLRLLAFFVATGLPAFYVASVVFHFDVIPIKLLLAVSATREQIPFVPFIEALFMLIIFELLRELGVRMPNVMGQTISIIGGMVMGQAAISSKIASPIMLVVVALTGIADFILPTFGDTLPKIRFILLFSSQILGFLGITIAYIIILIHLCSLESFGVPYMYPMSPVDISGLKDSIFRFPLWSMKKRSKMLVKENISRAKYRMDGENHVRGGDKK